MLTHDTDARALKLAQFYLDAMNGLGEQVDKWSTLSPNDLVEFDAALTEALDASCHAMRLSPISASEAVRQGDMAALGHSHFLAQGVRRPGLVRFVEQRLKEQGPRRSPHSQRERTPAVAPLTLSEQILRERERKETARRERRVRALVKRAAKSPPPQGAQPSA